MHCGHGTRYAQGWDRGGLYVQRAGAGARWATLVAEAGWAAREGMGGVQGWRQRKDPGRTRKRRTGPRV
jgi:hypothetical protein